MAGLYGNFDPNAVDGSAANRFDPLPAGTYAAKIIEAEEKETKSGTGRLINFTWEVIEGPFANRKFWQSINYISQSAQAQEIGQAQLKQIAESVGHRQTMQSTDPLHGRPVKVELKIAPAKGNYEAKNEVKKVMPFNGAAPQAQPQAQPQARPQSNRYAPQPSGQSNGYAPQSNGYAPQAQTQPQGNAPWQQQNQVDDDIPF